MSSNTRTPAVRDAAAFVTRWTDRERRLLKDTSRIGAWSLFGGIGLFLSSAAGVHWPLGIGWWGVGIGLSVGGLYTTFASGLMVRKLWRSRFSLLKLGALAGLPFGLAASSLGIWWISMRSWFQSTGPVSLALFLGLGLMLILIFGAGLGKEVSRVLQDDVPDEA